MGLGDHSIYRIYTCSNKSCEGQVAYQEQVKDKWRKVCPFCKKHTLLLDQATVSISTFIDNNSPKTLGSCSDQNRRRKEKETGQEYQITPKKPWWRNKKIDYNILKNPRKFVETGTI